MVFRAALLKILDLTLVRYADRAVARKQRLKQELYDELSAAWEKRLPKAQSGCSKGITVLHPSAQADSTLFARLPAEIRLHIYSYALCGNRLEITIAEDEFEDSRFVPFELTCPAAKPLLGFPLSCKLAFIEVERLIYAANTFSFPDLTSFLCFQRLCPAQHFHAIRTMRLRWPLSPYSNYYPSTIPPSDVTAWKSCCREMAEMEGLQSVTINLVVGYAEYEAEYFEPLVGVAMNVWLQVNVGWRDEAKEEWPFIVNRGVEGLL